MNVSNFAAGYGEADITPPLGIPLSGFVFRENRPSEAIDSRLNVRVLAMQERGCVHWLISYEVLGISAALEQQLLTELEVGIGPEFSRSHAILTATHTHSAPPSSPLEGEEPNSAYWHLLAERTVQAARQAIQSLRPASLSAATRRVPGWTINRRALLGGGRVSMALEPDAFVFERGPVDDTLTVLLFRDTGGQAIAAVVHFACHGTAVCTQHIGGDIPGVLAHRVGEIFAAPCLYLQGAAGDNNPQMVAEDHSAMVTWLEPLMACLDDMPSHLYPLQVVPLRITLADLMLAYQPLPTRADVVRRLADFERIAQGDVDSLDVQDTIRSLGNLMNITPGQRPDPGKAAYASMVLGKVERRILSALDAGHSLAPCRANTAVLRFGQIALACVSAELFTITGFRIRALSRDMAVLPVGYTAPMVGYIPDRQSMAKGGYEADDAWRFYRHPAPFAPDSEDRIVEAIGTLAAQVWP